MLSGMLRHGWVPLVLMIAPALLAQKPERPIEPNGAAHAANSDGTYLALRGALPSGEGVTVKDFTLEREGGVFHFEQGSFFFYPPINGHVTGAVFLGAGQFHLSPAAASEQHSLSLLTKSGVMSQPFTTVVFRFTDGTEEEIRKASAGSVPFAGSSQQAALELNKGFRKTLHENLEVRLLEDALIPGKGGFFMASFRMGGFFTGRNVLFVVDPEGTFHAAPDQVELTTYSDDALETWTAYTMQTHASGSHGVRIHVAAEALDVQFEKSGKMTTSAETTLTVAKNGMRVVRLNLFPTLRVSGVYTESGAPIDFIQEDKMADPDFAIVVPVAAAAGQSLRLLIRYAGPDAVRHDGEDVYYLRPGARESWYPSGNSGLGDFASFHMTFHLPKGLQIIATGKEKEHTAEEKGFTRSVWATDAPIAVAGFNLGNFKTAETKTPAGFEVSAAANKNLPEVFLQLAQSPMLGGLNTTHALNDELSQGSAAIQIYSDFFGKLPYDHVALTQQSACNFGQSWPMLVYLPICAFWDSTVQHELGLLDHDASYWQEVTPHEVSHQWWGQMVGFKSYRDQWMSEGFANFSVGVFLLNTNPKMDEYRKFWNEQHTNILEKNASGLRPIDVGPLTMGQRVSNEKTGDIYQRLIYSKGAYVLHMLEMMYWTPAKGHEPFKHSMHEFVAEYNGNAATTEDFKASLERTMPAWLDLRGDHKLDWFFDEYVYGTELPHYTLDSDFKTGEGDTTVAHFKLSQSNVSKSFLMAVPIYLQMQNGNTVRLGVVPMSGDATIEKTVKLGKLPSPAKKLLLNYNADVLSD